MDWKERCDDACQHGVQKPPLQTADGDASFPESEDGECWKTDIALRIVQTEILCRRRPSELENIHIRSHVPLGPSP